MTARVRSHASAVGGPPTRVGSGFKRVESATGVGFGYERGNIHSSNIVAPLRAWVAGWRVAGVRRPVVAPQSAGVISTSQPPRQNRSRLTARTGAHRATPAYSGGSAPPCPCRPPDARLSRLTRASARRGFSLGLYRATGVNVVMYVDYTTSVKRAREAWPFRRTAIYQIGDTYTLNPYTRPILIGITAYLSTNRRQNLTRVRARAQDMTVP